MSTIASPYKIAFHEDKLRKFLSGEKIYPATIEMDITTACDAGCHNCPSTRSPDARSLSLKTIERLFSSMDGETHGLLLSGGEPTQSENFEPTLALARRHGFKDVSIVTNGSRLCQKDTQSALLHYASVVRISLYGWIDSPDEKLTKVFQSISDLRKCIDEEGSSLEIGVSLLTYGDMTKKLPAIASAVRSTGAHWLYLHPRCTGWGTGSLGLEEQGDLIACEKLLKGKYSDFRVHVCAARYDNTPIQFNEYYTSHFLLVVGADGNLYIGTEAKYQPHCVVGTIGESWDVKDLWSEKRLGIIRETKASLYPGGGGRHRGILYNNLIQSIFDGSICVDDVVEKARALDFKFPHVL